MARIMCTQKLWRALRRSGAPPSIVDEPALPGTLLGTWAVRLCHRNRRGLVLALNERTYLTLLFPLAPRAQFPAHFARALEWALEDLGVPRAAAERETAIIDFLPLARLTNRSLTGSLNDLEFFWQSELDYTDDLRQAQRNLNEVPHAKRDPGIPSDAVKQLFSGTAHLWAASRVH